MSCNRLVFSILQIRLVYKIQELAVRAVFVIFLLLFGCHSKPRQDNTDIQMDTVSEPQITEDVYAKPEIHYDLNPLYGVYDHESTTKGFSAVLNLTQYGNDLYFTVSVSQGECKGESEGVVPILDYNENYYTGFYNSEDCKMQFSFLITEKKVDIKEVAICSHHGNACSFEGVYLKRVN